MPKPQPKPKKTQQGISPQIKKVLRVGSAGYYETIIADPKVSTSDRLTAAACRDRLLGLNEPIRFEISTPGGGPVSNKVIRAIAHRIATSQERADAVEGE